MHRVRLIDGPNPHTGCVEVYTNSTGGLDNAKWGAVCDYWWSFLDARVVCRQLGYPDAVTALYGPYSEGNGPYWLYGINCFGTEADIFTCDYLEIERQFCNFRSAAAHCLGM